jgi:hypothetical protein
VSDVTDGARDAAAEAAQNVVDEVTSWEYSAEPDTIGDALDDGLEQAGVTVDAEQRRRLVEGIDAVKHHDGGAPTVDSAEPTPDEGSS